MADDPKLDFVNAAISATGGNPNSYPLEERNRMAVYLGSPLKIKDDTLTQLTTQMKEWAKSDPHPSLDDLKGAVKGSGAAADEETALDDFFAKMDPFLKTKKAPAPPHVSTPAPTPAAATPPQATTPEAVTEKALNGIKDLLTETASSTDVMKLPEAERPAEARKLTASTILSGVEGNKDAAQKRADSLETLKTAPAALDDSQLGQTLWLAADIAKKIAADPTLKVEDLLKKADLDQINKDYAAWREQQQKPAPSPAAAAPAPPPPAIAPVLTPASTPPAPTPAPVPPPDGISDPDIKKLFADNLEAIKKDDDTSKGLKEAFGDDTAGAEAFRRGLAAGETVKDLKDKGLTPDEIAKRINDLKISDAAKDPELGKMLFTASNLTEVLKKKPDTDLEAFFRDHVDSATGLIKSSEEAWQTEHPAGQPAPGATKPQEAKPAQEVVWDPTPGTHDCMVLTYNPADKTVDVGLYQNGGPVSFRLTDKDKGITSLTGTITDVADAQAFDRIKAAAHGLGTAIFGSMVDSIPEQEKSAFDNVMNVFKAQASGTAPAPAPSATPDNTPDNSPATPAPAPNSVNPAAATPPAATPPAAAPLPPRVVHGYSKIKVNGADQDVSFVSNPQTGTSYTYTPTGQARRENWSEDDMVRLTGDKNIDQKIGTTQSLNKEELNRLAGYSAHLPDHGSMQQPIQGHYPGPNPGGSTPTPANWRPGMRADLFPLVNHENN